VGEGLNTEAPTDEEAQKAHRQWVAARRRAIAWYTTQGVFYALIATVLAVVLVLSNNPWWNLPGIMSAYSSGYYFRKAYGWVKM
jgi:hypothetical protein